MTVKRGGLGRNLSALLSHTNSTLLMESVENNQNGTHLTLPINAIQPGKYQPRREIADGALRELAASIKQQGLLQPLVVRKVAPDCYELLAGERRWRACQSLQMSDVPVILRQVDDETAMAIALIENLQREDLNAMDQAIAMQRLVNEFALTHQQVADLLCKSRTAVSNYLRLLNLNSHVRRLLDHGDLDMGHARSLLMLDETQQTQVADIVVAKQLSVRDTEALVARIKAGKITTEINSDKAPMVPLFKEQLQRLAHQLQTKVNIRQASAGHGTLVIHYDNKQTLENMIEWLTEKV